MTETPVEKADRIERWCRTASTWARKAAAAVAYRQGPRERFVDAIVLYDAKKLAAELVDAAETIVRWLPEGVDEDSLYLPELGASAEAIVAELRRRRIREKLANVEGRTEAEAAAFRAKADELAR